MGNGGGISAVLEGADSASRVWSSAGAHRCRESDYPLHLRVFSVPHGAVPRVTCDNQPKEVSADWAALPEPGAETLQTTGLEKRHPSDEMLILHSPSQDAQQCF